MNTTQCTVLLALVFALVASTLLAVDTDAKRKRKHKHRENRASIVRVEPNASFRRLDPNVQLPELSPDILTPAEPDPCNAAEAALNGFLVLAVSIDNFPNSLEGLVEQGLDAIFPSSITITI